MLTNYLYVVWLLAQMKTELLEGCINEELDEAFDFHRIRPFRVTKLICTLMRKRWLGFIHRTNLTNERPWILLCQNTVGMKLLQKSKATFLKLSLHHAIKQFVQSVNQFSALEVQCTSIRQLHLNLEQKPTQWPSVSKTLQNRLF